MENIENYEGGSVIKLTDQEQAIEQKDTHELLATLTERYDELEQKIVGGDLGDAEISDIQKEMNEIEEQRAQLESVTPAA